MLANMTIAGALVVVGVLGIGAFASVRLRSAVTGVAWSINAITALGFIGFGLPVEWFYLSAMFLALATSLSLIVAVFAKTQI